MCVVPRKEKQIPFTESHFVRCFIVSGDKRNRPACTPTVMKWTAAGCCTFTWRICRSRGLYVWKESYTSAVSCCASWKISVSFFSFFLFALPACHSSLISLLFHLRCLEIGIFRRALLIRFQFTCSFIYIEWISIYFRYVFDKRGIIEISDACSDFEVTG